MAAAPERERERQGGDDGQRKKKKGRVNFEPEECARGFFLFTKQLIFQTF